MKVFVVMDTTEKVGRESIIGVFESLEKAREVFADYVLDAEEDSIKPCCVGISEFEVKE